MRFLIKMRFKRALATESIYPWENKPRRGLIHSDTLFGAIANQWVKIPAPCSMEQLKDRLNTASPPFRISSAFPFSGDNYYLPTPRGTKDFYMDLLKNVPYLELSYFLKLSHGDTSHLGKLPESDPVYGILFGFSAPRLTVDRITCSTNVYDAHGWSFTENSGLYFILEIHNQEFFDTLEVCLHLLGEAGIGADRNVGFGAFKPSTYPIEANTEWDELFAEKEGQDITFCTLSLVCPNDNIEARESISYDIIPRKGWILSNSSLMQAKRRKCHMFAEGSLFKKPVLGQLADVTPSIFLKEHQVWRYGLGLCISGVW